jgi:FKBP-type peptidyl-prolyl cis-trans isomerase SlyD
MTEKTKKKDFVELDFSAYANGVLFDTTIVSEAKKAGIDTSKGKFEPLVVCIGEGMLLKGFDKALEDKEIDHDYEIVLKPGEAFGKRDPKLIKTIPLSAFSEIPHAGMLVNVNGFVAKVISVTSGRTLVDLNNPLMGKEIKYTFKIKAIVSYRKGFQN